MTDREEFEKWADKRERYHTTREWDAMYRAWQAATAAKDAEIDALKAERDTMLAALQGVAQMSRCGQLDRFVGEPWLNAVFAAIAKAEGRTG